MSGMQFDQGAVTNQGTAFFASNTGSLVMIDYSATGRIGDVHDTVQTQFLAAHLDDVAPLVGPGARPSTSPPLPLRPAGEASLLAAAVLGFWMLIRQGQRGRSGGRRGNTRKRLPRWDKRRDASDQPNWASGPIEDLDLFN
jgi:hypothetical protein